VISPHNRTFPRYFNLGRLTKTFINQTIGGGGGKSNSKNKQDVYLNISSPYPGYWFSAAFIDSNDQKVKPDLLRSNCSFYLTSSINLWQLNDTLVLYPNRTQASNEHAMFKTYKYMSGTTMAPLIIELNFLQNQTQQQQQPAQNCSLTALLRQSAFPDMTQFKNNNDYALCQAADQALDTKKCRVQIDYPLVDTWHYLAISSNCNYTIDVKNLESECLAQLNTNLTIMNMSSNAWVINLTKNKKKKLLELGRFGNFP
jgi:hypothetical protein